MNEGEFTPEEASGNKEQPETPELSPELQKVIDPIYAAQEQLARRYKVDVLPKHGVVRSAGMTAIYVPGKEMRIPAQKRPRFRQLCVAAHESTHASYDIAKRESALSPTILDGSGFANFREGLTGLVAELTMREIPTENPIIQAEIKQSRRAKKFQGKDETEIVKERLKEFRHSFQGVAEAVVNQLGRDGTVLLLKGIFEGNLTLFEQAIQLEFGEEFFTRLLALNINNGKEIAAEIIERSEQRKQELIELGQELGLEMEADELETWTPQDIRGQIISLGYEAGIDIETILKEKGMLE